MATSHLLYPALFTLSLLSLSQSLPFPNSIHDLMRSQGLPAGLFPRNIKSYNLDQDFVLEVHMEEPCLANYESRVFFDSVVRANVSYGGLAGVQGLTQEDLFLWLPVKEIIVQDPSSGLIMFDIGLVYKHFSFSTFEEPHLCVPIGHNLIKEFAKNEPRLRAEKLQNKPYISLL